MFPLREFSTLSFIDAGVPVIMHLCRVRRRLANSGQNTERPLSNQFDPRRVQRVNILMNDTPEENIFSGPEDIIRHGKMFGTGGCASGNAGTLRRGVF